MRSQQRRLPAQNTCVRKHTLTPATAALHMDTGTHINGKKCPRYIRTSSAYFYKAQETLV